MEIVLILVFPWIFLFAWLASLEEKQREKSLNAAAAMQRFASVFPDARVTDDGVFVGKRFVHFRSIVRTHLEQRSFGSQAPGELGGSILRPRAVEVVVLTTTEGKELAAVGSKTTAGTIQKNVEQARKRSNEFSELARGDRTVRSWLESITAPAGGYRSASFPSEQFLEIVQNGWLAPTVRAAAAVRLRESLNEEAKGRLVAIAADVGYEPLRLALNAIAKGETSDVNDALEALVDPPLGAVQD